MTLVADHTETIMHKGEEIHLPLFLDHQSTTPLAAQAREAMWHAFEFPGNAHSKTHIFGLDAADLIEHARGQVADLIGARADEIHFTPSATASNHQLLYQVARSSNKSAHFVTLNSEHNSIIETCVSLRQAGYAVTFLPVQANGRLDLTLLDTAIKPETRLVSIQAANNETGVLQDLEEVNKFCINRNIPFHTDAVQALGTQKIDVENGIACMSISAHKIYGPQGVGALYVRSDLGDSLCPKPAGTPATALIAGFGAASELVCISREQDHAHLLTLSTLLMSILTEELGNDVSLNGDRNLSIPSCLNIMFAGVAAEDLLLQVPALGLSTNSACLSSSGARSHVLQAMGLDATQSESSIRIGMGRYLTANEVDYAANMLVDAYRSLR